MPDQTNQAPAAGTKSNKTLYIIIGVVAVLAVLGFVGRTAGFMAMRASGVNIQPGPGGAQTYTSTDGQSSVTVGGNKMPDNWPSDAPQPFTGAQISYSGTSNPATGQAGSAVVYSVKAAATDVINYYKSQLTSAGWTVAASANMGNTSVLSAKKDTRTMGVSVTDAGNGTVQVTAGLNI